MKLFNLFYLFLFHFVICQRGFVCWIFNTFSKCNQFVFIFFLVPKLDEFKPKQTLLVGDKFKLYCYLNVGSKPVKFEWFRNGVLLANDATNYHIDVFEDESRFIVNQLDVNDSANYSCVAQNQFGSDTQSTQLIVKGLQFPHRGVPISIDTRISICCIHHHHHHHRCVHFCPYLAVIAFCYCAIYY